MAANITTLWDNFPGSALDTSKWTAYTGGGQLVTGNTLVLSVMATNAGIGSSALYDFSNGVFQAKVTPPAAASGDGRSTWMTIYSNGTPTSAGANTNPVADFAIDSSPRLLWMEYWDTTAQAWNEYSITYDAVAHAWLRFREANGTMNWETSADGIHWVTQHSVATSKVLADVHNARGRFSAGATSNLINVFANISNVNVGSALLQGPNAPTVAPAATATATAPAVNGTIFVPSAEDVYTDFTGPDIDALLWASQGTHSTGATGLTITPTGPASNQVGIVETLSRANYQSAYVFAKVDTVAGLASGATDYCSMKVTDTAIDGSGFTGSQHGWAGFIVKGGWLSASYMNSAGTVTEAWGDWYNYAAHAWWRVRDDGANILWETSRDGIGWAVRAQVARPFVPSAHLTRFECGYTDATNKGPGDAMRVSLYNTPEPLSRATGSTFLSDNFNTYPTGVKLANGAVFGPWKQISGSPTVQVLPLTQQNRYLDLNPADGVSAEVQSNYSRGLRQVDLTVGITVNNQNGASATDCPTVGWRVQSTGDRYYLQIRTTEIDVVRQVGGATTTLLTVPLTTALGLNYVWRVSHYDDTIIIYREQHDPGLAGPAIVPSTEVGRTTDQASIAIRKAGQLSLAAAGSNVSYDNVLASVASGSDFGLQPAPLDPSALTSETYLEYAYLTEPGYEDLWLLPSYGGIWVTGLDLGSPSVREVVYSRALLDGSEDATELVGPKAVALGLIVRAYQDTSIDYQLSLLNRWVSPRRRPTLVYKRKDGPERSVGLRAKDFSAPLVLADRDQVSVQLQWAVPDGREYGPEQSLTLIDDGTYYAAVNNGTKVTEPLIRFYGPCVNPLLVNDSRDSRGIPARLGFTVQLMEGQYIEVDVTGRTAQLNGDSVAAASRRSLLTTRDWFSLDPFRNDLIYTSDDGQGLVEIIWKDAY